MCMARQPVHCSHRLGDRSPTVQRRLGVNLKVERIVKVELQLHGDDAKDDTFGSITIVSVLL